MQKLSEEVRYDDEKQRQIIALAAELQRLEYEGATLAQLESRARDAGIDPKYVRMAAGQVPTVVPITNVSGTTAQESPWYQSNELAILSSIAFVVTQAYCVFRTTQLGITYFPISIVFVFLMGLCFSRNSAHRFGAIAALVGSTVASSVLYMVASKVGMAPTSPYLNWGREVFIVFGVEFVVLMIAFAMTATGRWFLNLMKRP